MNKFELFELVRTTKFKPINDDRIDLIALVIQATNIVHFSFRMVTEQI